MRVSSTRAAVLLSAALLVGHSAPVLGDESGALDAGSSHPISVSAPSPPPPPVITVGEYFAALASQVPSVVSVQELLLIGEAIGYSGTDIYSGSIVYPPGISSIQIGEEGVLVHGTAAKAAAQAARIREQVARIELVDRPVNYVEDSAVDNVIPQTAAGTREWFPGREIRMYRAGNPVATCTQGYHFVLYSNGLDYWYSSSAGHCAYNTCPGGGVMADSYRWRNFSDSNTFGTGSPLSGYCNPDVSVWYLGQTFPHTRENNASSTVWDFCNGVTCTPSGSIGIARSVVDKVSFGIGTVLCHTGQTTGTGCGAVMSIELNGRTRVNMDAFDTTNCGTQGGDSGGPWFWISGGVAYAAGNHHGGASPIPQRPGCGFAPDGIQTRVAVFDLASTIEAQIGAYIFTTSTGY